MAVSYEQLSDRQQEVLHTTGANYEEVVEALSFLAFYSHLRELGRQQDRTPQLHRGDTTISIPAFYALPGHTQNALGSRALELLPKFSYSPGYADSTQTGVNESEFRDLIRLPDSELEAASRGKALDFIMAKHLGLNNNHVRLVYATLHNWGGSTTQVEQRQRNFVTNGRDLARTVNASRDLKVTGTVAEVAGYTRSIGANDMFTYLQIARYDTRVDVKQLVDEAAQASALVTPTVAAQ